MTGGSFFSSAGRTLDLDASDLQNKIDYLRGILSKKNFEQVIYRTFGEVGKKAKTIVGQETRKDYAAPSAWVKAGVQKYKLSMGGMIYPVKCEIPLKTPKGVIGGTFKTYRLNKGKISTQVLKRGRSRLPPTMKNQGGNPPFMAVNVQAPGKQGMEGKVFTRRTKKRLPVVRVVAMAVPQFPLNRSEEKVQDELLKYAVDRLDHNFEHMFVKGNMNG